MDDSKTGMQETDTEVESPSESGSPEKSTENEESCGVAQLNSPPLNNEGEKETKSPKKSLSRMLSFPRRFSKSFREASTKGPGILRSRAQSAMSYSKQTEDCVQAGKGNSSAPEESGESEDGNIKKEPASGPSGSPEKSTESEDSNCTAQLNPPPSNDEGEKDTASPSKPLATVLSFRRKISQSFKEPGILRSSKRFATKWIEGRIQAHRESKSLSEESGTLEDDKKEPLSVMEINTLIQRRQLMEAFENIKDLEMDLLVERDSEKYEDNPKKYTVKAKDIALLYDHISEVIRQIVQEMLDLSSLDEKALTSLAILIETEEEIHSETSKVTSSDGPAALGSARNWRELWKEAVNQSVKGRVSNVPVPSKEDTEYWLSVHLESLRTAIRDDLLKVKSHIQECYPQDYNVCDTYMEAFHKALSVHLQGILEDNTLTLSEFYALLNWIHNVYLSEEFLGHPDLKPDLKIEDLPSLLTPEAMAQLKDDYINSVQEKTKIYLDNILALTERKWDSKERPEAPQSQYCSSLSLDIQTMVGQHVKTSGNICESLKGATLEISVKEVIAFVPRFEKAFLAWDRENDHPQFVELMVTNINDLHDLMTGLEGNFGVTRQELEKPLNDVMLSYQKHFLHKLRPKTQPMFKKILSREWILHSGSEDSFIQKALSVTEEFSKPLIHLKEPGHKKNFLQEIYKDMVKEYVTQTLKSKRKMKRRKWEEVRKLMKQDAATIDDCMKHLGSTSDWLSSAIPRIADIIGEKKKPKVNEHLKNLSQDYPDIRREHVLALLALRGWWRNTRRSMADQIDGLSEGLETAPDKMLFAEIELPNTIQCFWKS